MNKKAFFLALFLIVLSACMEKPPPKPISGEPLFIIKKVADKVLASARFEFKADIIKAKHIFNFPESVNLARTFGRAQTGVGYAYTQLEVRKDTVVTLEISYTDGIKIWLNNSAIYEQERTGDLLVLRNERSLKLQEKLMLDLKNGTNSLLIKSETGGKDWQFMIQPENALLEFSTDTSIRIGLNNMKNISAEVASLSNWLVVGPFENPVKAGKRTGLEIPYGPENGFQPGKIYQGLNGPVTWTIPKVEIIGSLVGEKTLWGTYANYNYHNAGLAWAMMKLSEMSADSSYDSYAKKYTDFHLNSFSFIDYQVNTLHQYNSVNNQLVNTPLLDFTLATSLPYIYRLIKYPDFSMRKEYEDRVNKMIEYAMHEQTRAPDGHFVRLTPKEFTTWTDDMFMGLPFLVYASEYIHDVHLKERLMDDAANQVLMFNREVWDSTDLLYHHAQYSRDKVKMPYWSRANGWGIWAVTQVLSGLPQTHPKYPLVLAHYKKHIDKLASLQNKDGYWYNVLNEAASGNETSGTAIFTMAIAKGINMGWLDRKKYEVYAKKGWEALLKETEEDGTVHGICVGTMCSIDPQYYYNRPQADNDSHGLLGYLCAGMEMQKLLKH